MKKKTILYFSPIAWDAIKQRPQHLAEELSEIYKVIYVEPSLSVFNSNSRKNGLYKQRSFSINKWLDVIRPPGFRLPRSVELASIFNMNTWGEFHYLKPFLCQADVLWFGSPIFSFYINERMNIPVVYDRMDDYKALVQRRLMKQTIHRLEKSMINSADAIITTSEHLYKDSIMKNKNVWLVRNGLDLKEVDKQMESELASELSYFKNQGMYIYGYLGAIDHWFDYNVINIILQKNKNSLIYLIGPNNIPKENINSPRVRYISPIPKEQVYSVIREFDVCLYPFKKNEMLDSINPVKIYEYLSCNRKVLAIYSNETKIFSEGVYLYRDYEELGVQLENLLSETDSPFSQRQLFDFRLENSWNNRAIKIIKLLNSLQ